VQKRVKSNKWFARLCEKCMLSS